jgi:hypothetical protein
MIIDLSQMVAQVAQQMKKKAFYICLERNFAGIGTLKFRLCEGRYDRADHLSGGFQFGFQHLEGQVFGGKLSLPVPLITILSK